MMDELLFEDIICKENCPPLIFKGATDNWPASRWSPESLAAVLQENKFQCKVSPVDVEGIQWETESLHVEVTLQQYTDWLNGESDQHNLLRNFDHSKFSCYIDYKYMKEFFKDHPELLKAVDWSVFGLEGRDGEDSTLWIGSSGAYTPCHYDTYGYNLVAQLYGRKRWYLFSPQHSESLYPTRLPFEESSVFSEVNIRWPDLKKHRLLKDAEVLIVDLQPGEVLYVPRHWWHFVECLDSSISVNTWIPLKEDTVSHFHEALSRCLFTCMSTLMPCKQKLTDYINTNEELQPVSVNLSYLNTTLQSLQTQTDSTTRTSQCSSGYGKYCQSQDTTDEDDNFKKFCQTFIGYPVRFAAGKYICEKEDLHISGKRKAEMTNACFIPCKVAKHSECDTEELVPSDSDGSCNLSDIVVGNKRTCKTEIFHCRTYSFEEYLSFLTEKYDYDRNIYETQSSSYGSCSVEDNGGCVKNMTVDDIINSVLQPEVIQHVSRVLQSRVQGNVT